MQQDNVLPMLRPWDTPWDAHTTYTSVYHGSEPLDHRLCFQKRRLTANGESYMATTYRTGVKAVQNED
jgi:hypothetical protein